MTMPIETTYHVRADFRSPTGFRSGMPVMEPADEDREEVPFENDSLVRRETALNARVARFEEIVRQTKLEMAERQSEIDSQSRRLDERAAQLDEEQQRLRLLADELAAREEALTRRAQRMADWPAEAARSGRRTDSLGAAAGEWEEFQARASDVLVKIGKEKRELEALLAQVPLTAKR